MQARSDLKIEKEAERIPIHFRMLRRDLMLRGVRNRDIVRATGLSSSVIHQALHGGQKGIHNVVTIVEHFLPGRTLDNYILTPEQLKEVEETHRRLVEKFRS